jgi:hypothetical protein
MYQRGRCCLGGWKTLPPRVELTYHNHDHQTFHLDDLGYSATDCSDRNNICDNSLREKARTKLRNFSAVEKTPSRAEPQPLLFLVENAQSIRRGAVIPGWYTQILLKSKACCLKFFAGCAV